MSVWCLGSSTVPTGKLFAIGFISTGGGMLFGYDMGIVSGAIDQLQSHFNLTCTQQEMVVSFLLLGAFLGSLIGGCFIDRFGRKISIIFASLLFSIGAVILAASQTYVALLLGRLVLGFAMALSAVSECVYVSEVSPANIRGQLVSLNEFGITVGILFSYFIGLAFANNTAGWRYMFGLSGIGGILVLVTMLFLPKSPRFLILCNKRLEAKKALASLRRYSNISTCTDEFFTIEKNLPPTNSSCISVSQCSKRLIFPIVVGAGLTVFQQSTGEPNILFYASTILKQLGFEGDTAADLGSIALGVSKVVATVFCLLFIDRWGRKKFLLAGCITIALCVFGITIIASTSKISGQNLCISTNVSTLNATEIFSENQQSKKWISLILLVLVVAAYSCSFGPVTWVILGEIFPTHLRGRLFALVTSLNWATNLVISSTFLEFAKAGNGLAGPFAASTVFGLLSLLFVYFVIPETKGRSLEEVQLLMNKGIHTYVKSKCCCCNTQSEPLLPLVNSDA
uniref:Proton myo-inositol cotransporter-like n=1 Tax=Phallusia mammillata TaxID=59560 RepID=A0A6F9DT57_9ASCI|nr:proton myo-inositol cotransporter-like [Phallusia mammillata]